MFSDSGKLHQENYFFRILGACTHNKWVTFIGKHVTSKEVKNRRRRKENELRKGNLLKSTTKGNMYAIIVF